MEKMGNRKRNRPFQFRIEMKGKRDKIKKTSVKKKKIVKVNK